MDRKSYVVDTAFIVVGSVFVLINNINMGAQLDVAIIKSVLRKPLGPLCGFVSQFAVMPLVGVSLHRRLSLLFMRNKYSA